MFRSEDRWLNLLSWIHAVLLFSGFYLLIAGVFGLDESDAIKVWLNSLWLFLPVITSWLFIRKIRGFIGYLLAGIVVIVVTALLSGNILTLIFSVLIFVIRAYVRIIQGKMNNPDLPGQVKEVELWEIPTLLDKPEMLHWIVFIVLYFAVIFLKTNYLLKWLFLLLFLEIFITYIYGSIYKMKNYVVTNCHIAHLPVKVMQRMQRAVLGITLVLLVIFVLPSVFYGEEPLTGITNLGLNLDLNIEEEAMEAIPAMPDPGQAMWDMLGIEEKEPNVILEAVLDIIIYIIMAIVSVGVIYALWHVCRKMMNTFEKGQESDEIISLDGDGESLAVKIRRSREKSGKQSSRQKIRKEYKKLIKKNMKEKTKGIPAGWETPEELEEKAGFGLDEATEKLHEIYEKARYSEMECDEVDVIFVNAFKKNGGK